MKAIIPWKDVFSILGIMIFGSVLYYLNAFFIPSVDAVPTWLSLVFNVILPIGTGVSFLTLLFTSKNLKQYSLQSLLSWGIYFLFIFSANISFHTSLLPIFFPIIVIILLTTIHNKQYLVSTFLFLVLCAQFMFDMNSLLLSLHSTLLHIAFGITAYYLGSFLTCHLHVDGLIYKCIFDREYRRQAAHAIFGISLSYLIYIDVLGTIQLLLILLCGGILVLLVKQGYLKFLSHILLIFERPHHFERFPGRGVFYFVCGGYIVSLFAPVHIASASILILALGDSITNIVGKDLGKRPLPYNKNKNIEGPLTGAFFGALMASLLVPLPHALLAALIAMFVETLPLSIGRFELDDNITIPVTAALILMLV